MGIISQYVFVKIAVVKQNFVLFCFFFFVMKVFETCKNKALRNILGPIVEPTLYMGFAVKLGSVVPVTSVPCKDAGCSSITAA
jgi:hypothetical protein